MIKLFKFKDIPNNTFGNELSKEGLIYYSIKSFLDSLESQERNGDNVIIISSLNKVHDDDNYYREDKPRKVPYFYIVNFTRRNLCKVYAPSYCEALNDIINEGYWEKGSKPYRIDINVV